MFRFHFICVKPPNQISSKQMSQMNSAWVTLHTCLPLSHVMLAIKFFYRLTLWMKKINSAKLTVKPTTLQSLPPTDEALDLNILPGHIQGAHWHYSVTGEPPKLDKYKFRFEEDPTNRSMLQPAMMPKGIAMAPEEILRITKCNCSSKFSFM